MKKYIYIAQAALEPSRCKVGITDNLDGRLKDYNSTTGNSKNNSFHYLFAAEVQNAEEMEKEFKKNFEVQREEKSREIYFYNTPLFSGYLEWIRGHAGFVKEVVCKEKKERKTADPNRNNAGRNHVLSVKERGISLKDTLQKAQNQDNDEFYTYYEDIEKEVSMYPAEVWKDKVVFCNCDDAVDRKNDNNTSNFALFFIRNFQKLGLKKLICTHFAGKVDLFNAGSKAYVFTKDGFKELMDFPKDYDGSFDHPYSLKILNEEADIVCTNPPFSKSVRYWEVLIKSKKKFLVISNNTIAVGSAYIPYFAGKKMWVGYNQVFHFRNPQGVDVVSNGFWFTNFPVKNREREKNIKFCAFKKIPQKFVKMDDAGTPIIHNNWIPTDYKKPFAVSTFPILSGVLEKGYSIVSLKQYVPYIGGKKKFGHTLIQKDKC